MQELNNELKAVQGDINIEVTRLAAKFQKDYLAALGREKLLRASLENQKTAENQLNESAIEYSLLKRDVDTNRQLYEGLLQKLKEAGVMTGLRSSNVRIMDPASPPTAPSSPNFPRNMMISLLVGLAGGVSLAFVLESRDNTVHSLEQAQMLTALPALAVIPLASRCHASAAAGQAARPARRRGCRGAAQVANRRGLSRLAHLDSASQSGQGGQSTDGDQRAAPGRQDHHQREPGHRAGAARRARAADRSRHAALGRLRHVCVSQ